MHSRMRTRAAATAAAGVATAALLGGPAASVAVDVAPTNAAGSTASGLVTKPAAPASSPRKAGSVRRASATRVRSRRAQSAPVDASVQGINPHGQGTVLAVALAGKEAVV